MTKQEAKKIALEKLCYYEKMPSMQRLIKNLPNYIKEKVLSFHNNCSLCELFCHKPVNGKRCGDCPLTCPDCSNYTDEYLKKNINILETWEV
jgi:hypothetical protein